MATCSGCSRELFDLQRAGEIRTEAVRALRLIGMNVSPTLEIISAHRIGNTLTVATRHQGAHFEYGVDSFRLPTTAECDPELVDWARRTPGQWILNWQGGSHTPADIPDLLADARQWTLKHGDITGETPTSSYPARIAPDPTAKPIVLDHFPTRPLLPATQAEADRAATQANNTLWDHVEDCITCLNAEDPRSNSLHCRTGAPLAQHFTDLTTIAHDWTALNDWNRCGGMERAHANDWIAT
ncbi:hypothetical protein ACWF8U_00830 [Streptomyces olivaceus]